MTDLFTLFLLAPVAGVLLTWLRLEHIVVVVNVVHEIGIDLEVEFSLIGYEGQGMCNGPVRAASACAGRGRPVGGASAGAHRGRRPCQCRS